MSYLQIKIISDFVFSSILIILLIPFFLLISLLILIFQGRPIIFKQLRPGLHGNSFLMYKFCTMKYLYDSGSNILPDSLRLTYIGRFLRSTSLDELPELFNVLMGDMSLVGPRPLLIEYLPLYSSDQARRHNVRPGITGWAQVNGRNAISWEDKFKYDVWYVENQSFWLDLKIIWLTIKKVIAREGISADGEATMPKFTGNQE